MKSKDEIIEILIKNFDSVYCDTCDGKCCEDCHRKAINWSISNQFAEVIADEILK